jgi:trehalose 6-phosphate synthase
MSREITRNQEPLIVIASNRGPYSFRYDNDDRLEVQRGAGGLVTALGGLAENLDVLWVAAAMSEDDKRWAREADHQEQMVEGIRLKLVSPAENAYHKYYHVISNPLLWFIQHQLWDAPRSPNITADTWDAWENGYLRVNKLIAEGIAESVKDEDRPVIIFPQDYQLYMVPHFLRKKLGNQVQIQPFVHIPWPSHDSWSMLPGKIRDSLLYSLLDSDGIGFQTRRDAFNFVQTCRYFLPDVQSRGHRDRLFITDRRVVARAYPISVDIEKVRDLASEDQTTLLKSQLVNFISDRQLILRVDRIEPSKNILRGLTAYRTLLENHPEHLEKVQMLCLLVPSRMDVEEYQDYMQEIMAEAGLINATFSSPIWEPIRLIIGDNYARAIAAMQLYSVLFVNPIKDGMNLVAKEGALVNQNDGVLVLSEQAGAYAELGEHALGVSPFDIHGTAQALHKALTMLPERRREDARGLQEIVSDRGVKTWFQNQVNDLISRE